MPRHTIDDPHIERFTCPASELVIVRGGTTEGKGFRSRLLCKHCGGRCDGQCCLKVPDAAEILAAAGASLDLDPDDDALTPRRRLDLLHAVRLVGRRWMRAQAEAVLAEVAGDFDDGKALFGGTRRAVTGFFGRSSKYLRELFAAGVLALTGPGELTAAQVEAIDRNHEVQIAEYLDPFRHQILDEARPLDGTFVARAEQFGSSAYGVAQNVVRTSARKGGIFNFEARHHYGLDQPCSTCQEEIDKGIVPIGTLLAIGEGTECRAHCHCGFSYYASEDGEAHLAGRGPLHEAAFGRRG